MRFALHVPNFADPYQLVDMAVAVDAAGWDGFFLWDHLFAGPAFPVPMADPWVVLGGIAARTQRIRLGTMVTPPARRRPQKLAREAVTVDHMSGGRMIIGVGLGNPPADEFGSFGESADRPMIAARLDEALDVVTGLWSGEPYEHAGRFCTVRGAQFLPTPVQQPRIPIWVAAQVSRRAPLVRAARWHYSNSRTSAVVSMVSTSPWYPMAFLPMMSWRCTAAAGSPGSWPLAGSAAYAI